MKAKEFTDAITKEWNVYFPGGLTEHFIHNKSISFQFFTIKKKINGGSNDPLDFYVEYDQCLVSPMEMKDSAFDVDIEHCKVMIAAPDKFKKFKLKTLRARNFSVINPEDAIKKSGILFKSIKDQLKKIPKEERLGSLKSIFESSPIKDALKEIYEGL